MRITLACALALVGFTLQVQPAHANLSGPRELNAYGQARAIVRLRKEVRSLELLMGRTPTRATADPFRVGPRYRLWLLRLWQIRRAETWQQVLNPPRKRQWLCIHSHEKKPGTRTHSPEAWATRTGNGYYGGLQMDMDFQRTYAPALLAAKGTADRWAWWEQIWTAERAYRSGRGFHPWPNTARFCGLI